MVNVTAAWQSMRVGAAFIFTHVQACLVMHNNSNSSSSSNKECANLDESETMIVAAARDAATMRKLSGIIAEPSLKTKRVPKRCSAGIMRLKVASISSFGC